MAANNEKKKKCETIIPAEWQKFTGPAFTPGMSVGEAIRAWHEFRKTIQKLSPTPKVYRNR